VIEGILTDSHLRPKGVWVGKIIEGILAIYSEPYPQNRLDIRAYENVPIE
jgi:hypothetical protein